MWDDMVDIHGNLHGRYVDNYSDEEVWEVDSDAYSKQSVSDSDDSPSFINDNTTDYESTDDNSSDDSFWGNKERFIKIYDFPIILFHILGIFIFKFETFVSIVFWTLYDFVLSLVL